jgi:hypothetical protein
MKNIIEDLLSVGKQALSKKLILYLIPALPGILIFLGGAVVVLMTIAPFLLGLDAVVAFAENVKDTFTKDVEDITGILNLRDFQTENAIEVDKDFAKQINDVYNDYLGRGATLDISLIVSTLYTPLSTTYDENDWNAVNNPTSVDDDADPNTEPVTKTLNGDKLADLARNMVTIFANEYACEAGTTDPETGETNYVIGGMISTVEYTEEKLPSDDLSCNSSTDTATKYTYLVDTVKYDNYLMNTYLPETAGNGINEFEIPENLTSEEKTDLFEQIIIDIHDNSNSIMDLLDLGDTYNYDSGTITYVPGVAINDTEWPIIYHSQLDYDGVSYGGIAGADIKSHGCGPTSMAIILSTLLNRDISPVVTTNWACSHGYCTSDGTDHDFFCPMAEEYGLKCEEVPSKTPSSLDRVVQAIQSGSLVVGYMGGPSAFTWGGHYIVLRGVSMEKNPNKSYSPIQRTDDNGKVWSFTIDKGSPYVLVGDPASKDRTNNYAFSLSYVAANTKSPPFIIISK